MRRSGWTRERGTRQTNKTGQDRGPRHAETYSTVGSQSGSAPHWLEAILQAPLKIYTGSGGGGWKACGSDVIQDNWGQTCLSWLQIGRMAAWVIQRHRDVKRPDFSGWGGHVGWGGGEWGAIIYLKAVADSHLSQVWQRRSCGSCAVGRRWSSVCQTPVFYSKDPMFTVDLLFNRFPVNANIIQLPIFFNDLVI